MTHVVHNDAVCDAKRITLGVIDVLNRGQAYQLGVHVMDDVVDVETEGYTMAQPSANSRLMRKDSPGQPLGALIRYPHGRDESPGSNAWQVACRTALPSPLR